MVNRNECQARFDGSSRLFAACWRQLLAWQRQGAIDTVTTVDDACRWLDDIAAEKVNNPQSAFYIYG